jgi:hypothetical protein
MFQSVLKGVHAGINQPLMDWLEAHHGNPDGDAT